MEQISRWFLKLRSWTYEQLIYAETCEKRSSAIPWVVNTTRNNKGEVNEKQQQQPWPPEHSLAAGEEGSVSLAEAVILHPDEHLGSRDPFQHRRAGNQPLASVTAARRIPAASGALAQSDIIPRQRGLGTLLPTAPLPAAHARVGRESQQRGQERPSPDPARCPQPRGCPRPGRGAALGAHTELSANPGVGGVKTRGHQPRRAWERFGGGGEPGPGEGAAQGMRGAGGERGTAGGSAQLPLDNLDNLIPMAESGRGWAGASEAALLLCPALTAPHPIFYPGTGAASGSGC